ncbi:putative HAD superfamily hydrolase [Desulfosporosinus orientis DSM 765]|uniref:Putative HAD superfamily hydrolase n=1 Tax=Desulfosporosinus orientis (strain ATCC 19365 / DSM 765 / NCIMB 8382 / VKM B-1628 / Singapore I) TaxID=768706 RepID=G7WEN2_DESOD|nr:HAD family hydrolase [Desulfosporosinus orientis]AET66923.1 putative HAD superfamily hydrolase [Desulfosporosinus orientis DSM 765]
MMKRLIFASDLDQTLIYSYRSFIKNHPVGDSISPIEWYEDRYISYITQESIRKLQKLSGELLFVPVTTRTKLQYERVDFLNHGIAFDYAITSNGGKIFYRGSEDQEWRQTVWEARRHCLEAEDLIAKFEELRHPSWVHPDSGKMADDLFYYCIIERERIPLAELAAFKLWAKDNNWELSIQGRKLYLVPQNVSKKAAVQYIKAKEGMDYVAAAGDSLLDLDMLKDADFPVAPAHGELYSLNLQNAAGLERIRFTQKNGIRAGEEILDYVTSLIS